MYVLERRLINDSTSEWHQFFYGINPKVVLIRLNKRILKAEKFNSVTEMIEAKSFAKLVRGNGVGMMVNFMKE
jgi:hypothetical protein